MQFDWLLSDLVLLRSIYMLAERGAQHACQIGLPHQISSFLQQLAKVAVVIGCLLALSFEADGTRVLGKQIEGGFA